MSFVFDKGSRSGLGLERTFTQHLCEVINSPRSLRVFLLLKYEQYQDLVDLKVDSSDYVCADAFADDYLVSEILSKSSSLPLEVNREKVALDSFFESERSCLDTNRRLLSAASDPYLFEARKKVGSILGPLTAPVLERVAEGFRFGPGAATGVKGYNSVGSDKYRNDLHLTYGLYPFYRSILGEVWHNDCVSATPEIVRGNRFTTVPKNAKTDRGICVEPTLNCYVQLGIGKVIRSRLKRSGTDLNTQEWNQELSKMAFDWDLATIDLSRASDSISLECVRFLLGPDWSHLLELARSPSTMINGDTVELEKFSSMGNGYTFELESLIFKAVVESIVPKEEHVFTAVYGDDIILPRQYAETLISTLGFLGLSVNEKKSFLAGSFFESCGADWFQGQNVRPFFARRNKENNIPYTVQLLNNLRKYAAMRGSGGYSDSRFRPLWASLLRATPKAYRKLKVPAALGDLGIIASQRECRATRASSF